MLTSRANTIAVFITCPNNKNLSRVARSAALFFLSFWSCAAQSQDMPISPHAHSTISEKSRYEIVQSHLAAKWTFRLDRFCGHVAQYVSTPNGGFVWQPMLIERLPKCLEDGNVHYQLFSSSLAARHTILINVDSGVSWLLATVTNKGQEIAVWQLFEK